MRVEVNHFDTRDLVLSILNNLMKISRTDLEGLQESTGNFSLENPESKRTHFQYKRTALSLDALVNVMHADICPLLRFYTAYSGSFLPMFRDYLSVPSSRVKKSYSWTSWLSKMGPIGYPETSIIYYHYTLCKIPKEGRSHLCRGESLLSRN
jgi:hypothetical protein